MEGFADDSQDGLGYEMPPQMYPNYGMAGGSPFNASQPGQAAQDEERDGDPKRRRIARVRSLIMLGGLWRQADNEVYRLVICVARKRSNAMARCPSVHIASITRQNVSSHRSKRRGILRRGKTCCGFVLEGTPN